MLQSVDEFIISIDALLAHIEFENDRNIFFQSGLKKYIGDSLLEEDFRRFVESKIQPSLINSRTFTYNNAIVTLYGCLENYLEAIVKEYITIIGSCCDHFKNLPQSIRKHHLNASVELLKKVQRVKGTNLDYRKKILKEVVKNMYTCIHEDKIFYLNAEAFALHTSNFRYDAVHNLFQKVGISGISRQCLEYPNFIRDLLSKHSIDSNVSKRVMLSLLISELDDLSQRRNEISHGSKTNDIESLDLLRSRILLIKSYGVTINEVVSDYLNRYLFSISKKYCMGRPDKLFPRINVFGFMVGDDFAEYEISVGDILYAENQRSKNKVISGKILSIKRGTVSLEKLSLPSSEPFSIGVSFKVTSHMGNREMYVSKGYNQANSAVAKSRAAD